MKGRKDTVNGLEKGEDKFMKEQDKRLQDLGVQISIYRKQKKDDTGTVSSRDWY